ncbi:hypothetical protein L916_09441 [Phytophthora nicotianae]|uniref:Uncharacterized protein n=1 Tax=Phytophthora nicotianae TaxID=4792 RepID=W2J071_PHYNI|nr:hypothetical protein L916_09441 [Phytophthora nicotianae]
MAIPDSVVQLDVLFQSGLHDEWANPSDYVCRSFTCSDLSLAVFVGWWHLPLHKVAAFYETTDCTYKHGYYTFNTGSTREQETGMYYFEDGPKRIRSVMLGHNEDALLQEVMKATKISHHCHLEHRFDSAVLDTNTAVSNTTDDIKLVNETFYGGLSANWSDVLPDTSANSGNYAGAGGPQS